MLKPQSHRYMTPVERFTESYMPVTESGCWIWLGALLRGGYGVLGYGGERAFKAHRLAWILFRGPIPKGMCVCHQCDVRCCVNPEHLFLGTYKENHQDMMRKGRFVHKGFGRRK